MPLVIPDDVLVELREKAPDAIVEIACRMFTADVLAKPDATRLTGLTRSEFEAELTKRGLPWIRLHYDESMEHELNALREAATAHAKKDR